MKRRRYGRATRLARGRRGCRAGGTASGQPAAGTAATSGSGFPLGARRVLRRGANRVGAREEGGDERVEAGGLLGRRRAAARRRRGRAGVGGVAEERVVGPEATGGDGEGRRFGGHLGRVGAGVAQRPDGRRERAARRVGEGIAEEEDGGDAAVQGEDGGAAAVARERQAERAREKVGERLARRPRRARRGWRRRSVRQEDDVLAAVGVERHGAVGLVADASSSVRRVTVSGSDVEAVEVHRGAAERRGHRGVRRRRRPCRRCGRRGRRRGPSGRRGRVPSGVHAGAWSA